MYAPIPTLPCVDERSYAEIEAAASASVSAADQAGLAR